MLSSFSCLYIISLAVASANHQECGADHDSQACDADSKDGPNESGIASCKIIVDIKRSTLYARVLHCCLTKDSIVLPYSHDHAAHIYPNNHYTPIFCKWC